jgi:hypothetical protein
MPTIVCPSCSQVAEFDAMRRASEEFCRNCDFPLFWARSEALSVATNDEDASRRRLPGAAGRLTLGSKVCPECGEMNLLDVRYCIRCNNDFDPPPPPPPPPPAPEPVVIELPPPPPPPLPPEPDHSIWWILALVAVGVLAMVLVSL